MELRSVKPQWKNSKPGDTAVVMCGKEILRKKILRIHRGSLARIFREVNYKRINPKASTVFEAVKGIKQLYPEDEEFMAFELV